ncbi:MAG: BrnT family toxin [Magnetococcales bacterium]|nr:BrnT family toxin [Magnetococcales bacterium]
MKIEFDPAKDLVNRMKHGESLREAIDLDWEKLLVSLDCRRDYGEPRQVGYAPKDGRIYCVVFVDRGDTRRIISLRKANKREVRDYVSARNIHGVHTPHS